MGKGGRKRGIGSNAEGHIHAAQIHTGGGKFAAKAAQAERVNELHAQGLSLREIERQTNVPFNTVRRWLNA